MSSFPCPGCGTAVPAGKKFCGGCGQRLSDQDAGGSPSSSSLQLGADSLNVLLEELGKKPGGPSMAFQGGRLTVRQGDMNVSLDALRLCDARMTISLPGAGAFAFKIEDVSMDNAGVGLRFDITRPS